MNESENENPGASTLAELKEECAGLRRQTNMLQVGLLVTSLTLTAYLGVQNVRAGKELEASRQILEASRQEMANIQVLVTRLNEYSRTHPDFVPILTKYGIRQSPTNSAAAPAPPKK